MITVKKAENGRKRTKIPKGKLRDALLISVLALLLVFAVWKIFYVPSGEEDTLSSDLTGEKEKSVAAFLSEIEGVGQAEVRIFEENGEVKSVAVVCEGAKNIEVNSNVREAVAAALGVDGKNVKIYKKEK